MEWKKYRFETYAVVDRVDCLGGTIELAPNIRLGT